MASPTGQNAERPRFASEEEARSAMVQLLKIPYEVPEVSPFIVNRWQEENLIIEDIRWKSLDNQEVPAYLVRPAEITAPLPAVVCLHGSSGSRESMITRYFGKGSWTRFGRDEPHQRLLGWARELARRGYIALAVTQRGLDRRLPDTSSQSKELLLYGRNLMGALIYEIRQAITVLTHREEVDSDRIGATGMSFGGITTFYSWIADPRIKAAAPICGGVGSLEVFLEKGSRAYHGVYWWVPGILERGDHGDFAAAMAPRPFMIWAPLDDIGMPREGVDHFLQSVEPAYSQRGASGQLVVHRPPGEHEFTEAAFEALTDFFDTYLRGDE